MFKCGKAFRCLNFCVLCPKLCVCVCVYYVPACIELHLQGELCKILKGCVCVWSCVSEEDCGVLCLMACMNVKCVYVCVCRNCMTYCMNKAPFLFFKLK